MTVPVLAPGNRIHLIGICGTGMSALAWVALERGFVVTGSDLRGGRECAALSAAGARVVVGHDPANVVGADYVAVSTAVPASNIEQRRAEELGIPVVHRAELLAGLITGSRGILVTGTHGKTTTTAMTTIVLQAAGMDPSFAIGGTLHDAGTSAHHGTGGVFVAEADESDRSFLVYRPDCAVITNVELDHHDTYRDRADVEAAFTTFLNQRSAGGLAVLDCDDPGIQRLLERGPADPVLTYGEGPQATLKIVDVELAPQGSTFSLAEQGAEVGRFRVALPGRHNVHNATAAVAAARWAGVAPETAGAALADFQGTQRRFQRIGTAAGVTVVDDYAHHPTELTATLAAARQTRPRGRVIAAFQPHRYSRTAALGPELGAALAGADLVVVTDVYAAGEPPVPGVTGALVAEGARRAGVETHVVPSSGDLAPHLATVARDGDLVLTLGAGDVTEVGPVLLKLLADRP